MPDKIPTFELDLSNPQRPRLLRYPLRRWAFCATPAYYTPYPQQSPTCPGWYFVWRGSQADYMLWPGEWDGMTCWVELPPFIQEILSLNPQP